MFDCCCMSSSATTYAELARVAASLSNPKRLRAFNLLLQRDLCVEELAALLGESEANTAAHLKALRGVGLVMARKAGKRVYQRADRGPGLKLYLALREAGEALSPTLRLLDEGLRRDESVADLTPAQLEENVGARRAKLLDLRPLSEYEAGHLPGATSLPFAELEARLGELPARRRLFVYCRGKYCPNAERGTQLLREAGYGAKRLAFGVAEWLSGGRALQAGGAP